MQALRTGPVTAFIGAGLSASLQPTWEALHTELQRISELQPPRQFEAAFAPADFADFRDAMRPEQYLDALRSQFGGLVTVYPDLYRIIDETSGFEQLVTTNYDEFLASIAASNNREPRLAVFPHLEDVGARYVYLHGRAETATRPSDLVLCEDDYGVAYEVPGRAKNMLRALFARAGLFVGSSLQDPDLLALLRERMRLPRSAGFDSVPPLFAIVSVKSNTGTEEDLARAAEVTTSRLRRLGVRAICYARDRRHSQLRTLLLQLRHDAEPRPIQAIFLQRARQLNRLGQVTAPNVQEVGQAETLIRGVPELARHFFQHSAVSPAWYSALKESIIIPSAVEPREAGNGEREIDLWAAGPYIERIAPQRPEIVVELVQRLGGTSNWDVQYTLTHLAAGLPDEQLAGSLETVATWMDEPNGSFNHVSDELVLLPDQLIARGSISLALRTVGELLLPMGGDNARRGLLRAHEYWLSQLRPAIERLINEQPQLTYDLLKDRLLNAIRADRGEAPDSTFWRAAIEDHEQNITVANEALHFLVETTRDALLAWIDASSNETVEQLNSLLGSDVILLRRLGLSVLASHPELIPLVQKPLFAESDFQEYDLFHELAVLLYRRFHDLDEGVTSLVHRVIAQGPSRLSNQSDEDWQEYRNWFRSRWLAVVPSGEWTEEERAWAEALDVSDIPEEMRFFRAWHGSFEQVEREVEGVDEPALRAAWSSGGASGLVATLRAMPGSWWPIADLIRQNPAEMLQLAPELKAEDGERLITYVSAYENVLDSTTALAGFDWIPLLELMERIIADCPAKNPRTCGQMASLIDRGITSTHNPIPTESLHRALTITAQVLGSLAHPLETDPDAGGRVRLGDQLNEPAGKAADAFMRCVWQMLFLAVDETRHLPAEASAWIDKALEDGWGGLEMRHALGEFWFVLEWGEPGWLSRHADDLWPQSDEMASIHARRAFLFGFLQARTLSQAALEALQRMFVDAILDLNRDDRMYLDDEQFGGRFAQSVVYGWLYDVDQFDFDGLLGEFLGVASDTLRAEMVRQLGGLYRLSENGNATDIQATEAKRDEYWRRRVDHLKDRLSVSEVSKELGTFVAWGQSSQYTLRSLEKRLSVSIDHLPEGRSAHDLFELIAAKGAEEPLPALRLLIQFCDRLLFEKRLYLWGRDRGLHAAIDAVCKGAKPSHRSRILQLADRMLRAGLVEMSTKLQGCGQND